MKLPLDTFGNLHRNQHPKYGKAPHKPILLLAVLDEIERGRAKSDLITLTPELVAAFRAYWRTLVLAKSWIERIANPFRFMVQEGFWTLVKNGVPVSTRSLGDNPTINQLTSVVDGAVLAPDLWELLQDHAAIDTLRAFLLNRYFDKEMAGIQPYIPNNPLDYEVERLKAEAQSKFRAGVVRETADETGYYVRHSLFPKVIKDLYRHSCAVCSLAVDVDGGGEIVDAAHIMPFNRFHNDDPRNGVALCKNHHWGFDAGWYTFSDAYTIVASPRLRSAPSYIRAEVRILLPAQIEYAPALEAIAWHRAHIYKR